MASQTIGGAALISIKQVNSRTLRSQKVKEVTPAALVMLLKKNSTPTPFPKNLKRNKSERFLAIMQSDGTAGR
jgi:hypothetical protein